jgi:hypothetical protein
MRRKADCSGDRRFHPRSIWIGVLCVIAMGLGSTNAQAGDYEPSNAGHPLRIVAYALHPVGVVYDYLLLRPAFWVGSHEPFRSLFGRTD